MIAIILLAIVSIILFSAYYFSTNTLSYWEKKGVKHLKPKLLFGNAAGAVTGGESLGSSVERAYNQFPNEKYVGFYLFRNPALIIKDLDLLKQILIKDFDIFADRGLYTGTDVFNENLLTGNVETWKTLRPNLSPVFSSGKLRNMFKLIEKCGNGLQDFVGTLIDGNRTLEVRELISKYTMEVIGKCTFGVESNAFEDSEKENINTKMVKKYLEKLSTQIVFQFLFGDLLEKLGITLTDHDVKSFYLGLVNQTINEREGKPKTSHDLMDLLIELRGKGSLKSKKGNGKDLEMTDVIMASQAVDFYAGGFDTSAGLISFMLHELALNKDVQDKLRIEVDTIYEQYGDITYDSINQMEYLGMVMKETLRKYPVIKLTFRVCGQAYKLPGDNLIIEKGTMVLIPIAAIHHDSNIYEEPNKFDPERFRKEKIQERHPFAFIPFSEGPRSCLGKRFAKLNSSVAVSKILRKFKVVPNERTERDLKFRSTPGTLLASNGIWVDFESRSL